MAQVTITFDTENPREVRSVFAMLLKLFELTSKYKVILEPREQKEKPKQK